MESQLTKTTVYLDKNLLFLIKKKALEERKTLKELMKEAVSRYLGLHVSISKALPHKVKFGGFDMGKIKGSLSREEIYDRF